jgi:hypothetical protein
MAPGIGAAPRERPRLTYAPDSENLPEPDVLAAGIAEDLQTALEHIALMRTELASS